MQFPTPLGYLGSFVGLGQSDNRPPSPQSSFKRSGRRWRLGDDSDSDSDSDSARSARSSRSMLSNSDSSLNMEGMTTDAEHTAGSDVLSMVSSGSDISEGSTSAVSSASYMLDSANENSSDLNPHVSSFHIRDFERAFRNSAIDPREEQLLRVYSCALSREILHQGKMYVTRNYICFRSRIFNVSHKICLPLQRVTMIEPRRIINIFPNSIEIGTLDGARYVFASFTNRNGTLEFLRQLRTHALSGEQPAQISRSNSTHTQLSLSPEKEREGQLLPKSASWSSLQRAHSSIKRRSAGSGIAAQADLAATAAAASALAQSTSQSGSNALPPPEIAGASNASGGGNGGGASGAGQPDTLTPALPQSPKPHNAADKNAATTAHHSEELQTISAAAGAAFTAFSAPGMRNAKDISGVPASRALDTPGRPSATLVAPRQRAATPDPSEGGWPVANLGPEEHAPTALPSPREHEKVLVEDSIQAPPGVVANIVFGKDTAWYRRFLLEVDKNRDLDELPPFPSLSAGSERHFEYVKPLSGPVGPKQTRCKCTEKIEKWDFNNYVEVVTTTLTPDVPAGSSFTTQTRAIFAWGDDNTTQMRLGTWLDWTGKTWLKVAIEKGAVDGQTSFCKSLVAEIERTLAEGKQLSGQSSSAQTTASSSPAIAKSAPVSNQPQRPVNSKSKKQQTDKHTAEIEKRATEAILAWERICVALLVCVLVLTILCLHFWRKSRASPKFDLSSRDLFRVQQELELWQWLEDRQRGPVQPGLVSNLREAAVSEAIAAAEDRLFKLKGALGSGPVTGGP